MTPWVWLGWVGGPLVVIAAVWRLRGWIDRLDDRLADLTGKDAWLARTLLSLDERLQHRHEATLRRLDSIERRLGNGDG